MIKNRCISAAVFYLDFYESVKVVPVVAVVAIVEVALEPSPVLCFIKELSAQTCCDILF